MLRRENELAAARASAKSALISIERSEAAWRIIAQATGDETAAVLASELRDLGRDVEAAFPKAWSFIRPGFDEPAHSGASHRDLEWLGRNGEEYSVLLLQ